MSTHRQEVRSTVDIIHRAVLGELSLPLVQNWQSRGIGSVALNPTQETEPSGAFAHFDRAAKANLRALLEAQPLADLREVEITFALQSSKRSARCIVAGANSTTRELKVVTIAGRSRIRTRWVHMWNDWEQQFEWPVGWSASAG